MKMASGELSQAQLLEIFHRDIEPTLSARHQHDNRPKLYMVAAQPGSGKTRAISSILNSNFGTVAEIGDNFRRYHPEYKNLRKHILSICQQLLHKPQVLGLL